MAEMTWSPSGSEVKAALKVLADGAWSEEPAVMIERALIAAHNAPAREPESAGEMLERLDHKAEDFDDGD